MVFFVSNVGACWVADVFHVVYRLSMSRELAKRARRVVFLLVPIRLANVCLLLAGGVRAGLNGSWVGCTSNVFMTSAYVYNSVMVFRFIRQFDVDKYFETHQEMWFSDDADATLVKSSGSRSMSPK